MDKERRREGERSGFFPPIAILGTGVCVRAHGKRGREGARGAKGEGGRRGKGSAWVEGER